MVFTSILKLNTQFFKLSFWICGNLRICNVDPSIRIWKKQTPICALESEFSTRAARDRTPNAALAVEVLSFSSRVLLVVVEERREMGKEMRKEKMEAKISVLA